MISPTSDHVVHAGLNPESFRVLEGWQSTTPQKIKKNINEEKRNEQRTPTTDEHGPERSPESMFHHPTPERNTTHEAIIMSKPSVPTPTPVSTPPLGEMNHETSDLHVKRVPKATWLKARQNALLSSLSFRDYVIRILDECQPLLQRKE